MKSLKIITLFWLYLLLSGCVYQYSNNGNIKHNRITGESWVLESTFTDYYWKKVYSSYEDLSKKKK